jgi:hypothetical protein
MAASLTLLAVSSCKKNHPPDTPAISIGPTAVTVGVSSEYGTSTTDPDADSIAFRFSWGDGDTSDWSNWVASGETVAMSHAWSGPGTLEVRTQAKDRPGATSNWSEQLSVTVSTLGTVKWRCQVGDDVYSSPAIGADGTVYVGSADHHLYAIDSTGTLKWRYLTGDVSSSPAVGSDGTIYVGSGDDYLYAFNSNGTLKWRYQTGGDIWSSPAVGSDGTIYAGSYDGYFYALNPDGTLKWSYKTGDLITSSPAISSDGTIYVGSYDGYLYALQLDGALKWRLRIGEVHSSSPAIATDGTVYIGAVGAIFAVNAYSPLADSPWPKFHHDLANTGRVGGGR